MNIRKKALGAISAIRRSSSYLPKCTSKMLYNALVLSHMDYYCSVVRHSRCTKLSQSLERVQNYGMQVILSNPPHTPSAPLRQTQKWTTLEHKRQAHMLCQIHRMMLKQAPSYLLNKFQMNSTIYHSRSTRGLNNILLRCPNTKYYNQSLEFQDAYHYNKLNTETKSLSNLLRQT